MHPLIPVLIAFVSGIALAEAFRPTAFVLYLLLALSAAAVLGSYYSGLGYRRHAAALAFAPLGALFMLPVYSAPVPEGHISRYVEKTDVSLRPLGMDVEAVVLQPPEYAADAARVPVRSSVLHLDGEAVPVTGDVMLAVAGLKEEVGPGDRIRFVARLRIPSNFGNPGEYDHAGSLAMKGVLVTGYVKSPRFFVKTGEAGWSLSRASGRMRGAVRRFFDGSGLGHTELLKALVIGEGRGMAREEREPFSRTGTLHVLAISGQNVGMVAWAAYAVILFLLKRSERLLLAVNVKKAAAALALAPVLLYGMVSGFPVSAERAVIMAFAFVLAFVMGRGKDHLNGAALAALAILAYTPWALWDVSFQLTFAAVFAIIVLVPRMEGLMPAPRPAPASRPGAVLNHLKRWGAGLLFVTVAASIGTYPVLAHHFHRLPATGLAANVVAVPLTGAAGALASTAALLVPVSGHAAYPFLYAADLLFGATLGAVRAMAALPYSSITVIPPSLLLVLIFYILVLSLLFAGRSRPWRYAAAALAVALLVLWRLEAARPLDGRLRVTFLSVGQGDSSIVEFPDGKVMLIDGGGLYGNLDTGERIVLPYLLSRRITRVDYMVLSHAQRDHMDGLRHVAASLPVGEFWWNGRGDIRSIEGALRSSGALMRRLGASAPPVEAGGAVVEPLHPADSDGYDVNGMSLTLRVRYGAVSFLFPGDIGGEAEAALAARGPRAVVLKSPHHGSRNSSGPAFMAAVRPSWVVVSAGRDNPFGFPHAETLERYGAAGATVLRTDRDGAVTFSTDGRDMEVLTHLTRR